MLPPDTWLNEFNAYPVGVCRTKHVLSCRMRVETSEAAAAHAVSNYACLNRDVDMNRPIAFADFFSIAHEQNEASLKQIIFRSFSAEDQDSLLYYHLKAYPIRNCAFNIEANSIGFNFSDYELEQGGISYRVKASKRELAQFVNPKRTIGNHGLIAAVQHLPTQTKNDTI